MNKSAYVWTNENHENVDQVLNDLWCKSSIQVEEKTKKLLQLIWMFFLFNSESHPEKTMIWIENTIHCQSVSESKEFVELFTNLAMLISVKTRISTKCTAVVSENSSTIETGLLFHYNQKQYEKVLQLSKVYPRLSHNALNLKACALVHSGELSGALNILGDLLEATSDRSIELVVIFNIAMIYVKQGKFEKALKSLEIATGELEKGPLVSPCVVQNIFNFKILDGGDSVITLPMVLVSTAIVQSFAGFFEKSVQTFDKYFKRYCEDRSLSPHFERYVEAVLQSRVPSDSELAEFLSILQSRDTKESKFLTAKIFSLLSRYEESLQYCEYLLNWGDVIDVKSLALKMYNYTAMGNFTSALSTCRYLIAADDSLLSHYYFAFLCLKLNNPAEAVKHWMTHRFKKDFLSIEDMQRIRADPSDDIFNKMDRKVLLLNETQQII